MLPFQSELFIHSFIHLKIYSSEVLPRNRGKIYGHLPSTEHYTAEDLHTCTIGCGLVPKGNPLRHRYQYLRVIYLSISSQAWSILICSSRFPPICTRITVDSPYKQTTTNIHKNVLILTGARRQFQALRMISRNFIIGFKTFCQKKSSHIVTTELVCFLPLNGLHLSYISSA